jgi:hypothetical protein
MKVRHCSVLLSVVGGLAAGSAFADVAVPEALAVPPDMQLILSTHAEGAQVYACSPDSAWTLKGPDAVLFDEKGNQIGKHYAGPSWELSDGSLVTGEAVAKDAGPDSFAVPWLLLKIKTNSGKGLLGKAGLAQRIETKGGLAPKESCKPGDETRSAYSATYRFFAVKS